MTVKITADSVPDPVLLGQDQPVSFKKIRGRTGRDLTGNRYGMLTVIEKAVSSQGSGTSWICQCDCGRQCKVTTYKLTHGVQYCCGCRSKSHPVDITGQKFRMLTALYPTENRDYKGSVIWHCRCECGNELDVSCNALKYGEVVSCGCQQKEHRELFGDRLGQVAGTTASRLRNRKATTRSKTGVRGVFLSKGRYVAAISIQGKSYHLGSYEDLESARAVRQEAEYALFDQFLDYLEEWKEMDPAWRQKHPIQLKVEKDENNHFRISILPDLMEREVKYQQPVQKKRRSRKKNELRGEEALLWKDF